MSEEIRKVQDIKEQNDYLIYNRDVIHKHSKAIQTLLDFVLHHIDAALEEGKNGKKVVWIGSSNVCPLLYACGAIPLSIPDMARVGKMKTIQEAEDFFQIPAETCAMVKAVLGGFYHYKDSPCNHIMIPSVRCEPELTASSMLRRYGYDVFILDIAKKPISGTQERARLARERYREELEKLAFWISGKEIDREKLYREIVRANRIHKKLDELMELQWQHPTYMRALPTMLLLSGKECYYGQPDEYETILDAIIDEFKGLSPDEYKEELVKLVWSGARGVDFSVYNAIDICGGQIAGWQLPISGDHYFDETLEDSLDALLDYVTHGFNVAGQSDICAQTIKLFEKCHADGVLVYITLGCTFNTINAELRRRYVGERGIPTLALAGTAQIGEATGQVMTRLKAFIEMLS